MIKIISIVFLLLNCPSTAWSELNCKLVSADKNELKLGAPISIKFVFWPKEEFHLAAFQEQNKNESDLLGAFYINQITSTKVSEYNEQAVVIDLEIVPLKAFDVNIMPMYSDSSNSCMVQLENIKFGKQKEKPEITIIDQKSEPLSGKSRKLLWSFLSVVIIFVLALLILIGKRVISKNKMKHRIALRKDYFKHLFASAEHREDYEKIYAIREEWIDLINSDNHKKDIEVFFAAVNLYQYQKEWKEKELNRCRDAFSKIRGVWNG